MRQSVTRQASPPSSLLVPLLRMENTPFTYSNLVYRIVKLFISVPVQASPHAPGLVARSQPKLSVRLGGRAPFLLLLRTGRCNPFTPKFNTEPARQVWLSKKCLTAHEKKKKKEINSAPRGSPTVDACKRSPLCRMLRFQSLAVSRPLTNWNSLGVSHSPRYLIEGPLLP